MPSLGVRSPWFITTSYEHNLMIFEVLQFLLLFINTISIGGPPLLLVYKLMIPRGGPPFTSIYVDDS